MDKNEFHKYFFAGEKNVYQRDGSRVGTHEMPTKKCVKKPNVIPLITNIYSI